jgi:hypothetical protein
MTVVSGLLMARETKERGGEGVRQVFCGAPTNVRLTHPEAQSAAVQRRRVGSTNAESGLKLLVALAMRAGLKAIS